jgi:DNA-binding response OmpR family regulator
VAISLLAVDDSVTMRKVLEITFAGENYKTAVASSGQEAMNLLKSEKPAIALLDHTLPDGSGYDLAHQIKQAMPNVAVLMLSSKQNPYDRTRGQASGVDDFMDKPFDTQKLIDKVTQVLAQPRAAAAPAAAAAPPAPAPAQPAPAAHAPVAAATASRAARTQTLAYGTPAPPGVAAAPPSVAAAPRTQTTPGTPKPAVAAPAPAPVAAPPAPAPARPIEHAAAAASAAISAGNGQLTGKLEGLGLTPQQVDGVLSLSREVVERVVWEVVPVLAEALIKEEIRRLTSG